MLYEIEINKMDVIVPLFKENRYDTVQMNSVLDGYFGVAYADSITSPSVARLDSGAFTILGGNPGSEAVTELLHYRPIYYVTPENHKWKRVLRSEFGDRISVLPFAEFSSQFLDMKHLDSLTRKRPSDYELININGPLAKQLPADLNNDYFLENFKSIDDFLKRGLGYCILYKGKIISAATSTAMCNGAIDIEIETIPEFQQKGLGTAVGAQLVLDCMKNNIEPKWLAANIESEKLAQRLGFIKGDTYETFEVKQQI